MSTTTPETAAPRKLRFLGDGVHGEKSISSRSNDYDVDISPLDMQEGYRQGYLIGVYSDPDAEAVADTSSMDAAAADAFPACPCGSVI